MNETLQRRANGESTGRNRHRIVAFGLTSVAFVVVAGFLAYVATYEPLVIGSGAFGVDGPDLEHISTLALGSEYHITVQANEQFVIMFDLSNSGPWGVTVTGFDLHGNAFWRPTGMKMQRGPASKTASGMVALRPFALRPGDSPRFVGLFYEFADCDPDDLDAYAAMDSVTVEYRVLGIPRSMELELASPVVVRGLGRRESCRSTFEPA